MSREFGREGMGEDLEVEGASVETSDILQNFLADWESKVDPDVFHKVIKKINAQKSIDLIESEVTRLEQQLAETHDDDELIADVFNDYVRSRGNAEIDDDLDDAA